MEAEIFFLFDSHVSRISTSMGPLLSGSGNEYICRRIYSLNYHFNGAASQWKRKSITCGNIKIPFIYFNGAASQWKRKWYDPTDASSRDGDTSMGPLLSGSGNSLNIDHGTEVIYDFNGAASQWKRKSARCLCYCLVCCLTSMGPLLSGSGNFTV